MDHRQALASLTSQQRLALTQKSDAKGLMALAWHAGCIGVVSVLITMGFPYWWLLLPIQGILLIFLFTLLHETIHRTVFGTRTINDVVAHICGFLIGIQPEWFRYFHFAHHRHTQDPENDPELATPKPQSLKAYVWHISGLPVWYSSITTLVSHGFSGCEGDAYVPKSGRGLVVREARLSMAAYAVILSISVFTGSTILLWVWIVPLLFGQPFLRLYLLAEHGRCAFVANMLENSRTTFTNRLVRRLAWNMPYHAEHHSFPTVPFHQLPNLHTHLQRHLKVTEKGYSRFHRAYIEGMGGRNQEEPVSSN